MDSENQKNFLAAMEEIIVLEASLIKLKNEKLAADREFEYQKAQLEHCINAPKRMIKILKQTGCENQIITDIAVDNWIEEENEKEIKRLKNLTPEERMKENFDRIEFLREAEKNNWYCSK